MKLSVVLSGIIIATGVLAAAVKGYIHYQVKNDVDDLIKSARVLTDIQYKDLDTDISGSVTLNQLVISPHGLPEQFEIDRLTITGPDIGFLLDGFGAAQQHHELPERIALYIQGWHISADSLFVKALQNNNQKLAEALQINYDGCSLGQALGSKDLKLLGLKELSIDMRAAYHFSDIFPGMEINLNYHLAGESGDFKLALTDVDRSMQMSAQTFPKLREVRINYQPDPMLSNKIIDHCAKLRGLDRDAYITQLGNEPDKAYQLHLGFVPGPGLREAFQDLLRNPGEMQLSARPIEPVDLSKLALYTPEQIIDLLGVTLSVNQNNVEDLSLSILDIWSELDEEVLASLAQSYLNELGIAAPALEGAKPPSKQPNQRAITAPRYQGIEPQTLGEHIGQQVRIVATGARKRNGQLLTVKDGLATLEERRYGGALTSTIALKEIMTVEVLR